MILLNAIEKEIMRDFLERLKITLGKVLFGGNFWNIKYIDDTAMVARSREECYETGETMLNVFRKVILNINRAISYAMTVQETESWKSGLKGLIKWKDVPCLVCHSRQRQYCRYQDKNWSGDIPQNRTIKGYSMGSMWMWNKGSCET